MFRAAPSRGFTLLELLAALAIAGLVLAVSVPASVKMYDSMRYRETVRELITLFASARYQAINSGFAQNVEVHPDLGELRLNQVVKLVPAGVRLFVESSAELNLNNVGIIRFYPEGGSSGGSVDIQRSTGAGVKVSVDWLLGSVSQETYGDR